MLIHFPIMKLNHIFKKASLVLKKHHTLRTFIDQILHSQILPIEKKRMA